MVLFPFESFSLFSRLFSFFPRVPLRPHRMNKALSLFRPQSANDVSCSISECWHFPVLLGWICWWSDWSDNAEIILDRAHFMWKGQNCDRWNGKTAQTSFSKWSRENLLGWSWRSVFLPKRRVEPFHFMFLIFWLKVRRLWMSSCAGITGMCSLQTLRFIRLVKEVTNLTRYTFKKIG